MPSATAPSPLPSCSDAVSERDDALAVYVHWPFCARKCPYCDFNSHVREAVDEARWRRALAREIAHAAAQLPDRRTASIFFGGGTPSLMAPATVEAVVGEILGHWPAAGEVEITLEANPSSVEAGRFAGYRAAGVNRLSIGVQSLDDAALRFLGRLHDAASALRALEIACRTFDRVSCDLIYALPDASLDAWRAELDRAIDFGIGHLSLYQLTIEEGTAFHHRHARGELVLPDESLAADLFELTQERTAAAGLPAYEISNHARAGEESRHNLACWQAGDYVGVGPGAHGRVHDRRGRMLAQARIRRPEVWLAAVESSGHGTAEEESIAPRERAEEAVMFGLRLADGIDKARFQRRTGLALADAVDPRGLDGLVEAGLLCDSPERLVATARGRLLLNAMLRELLANA